MTASKLVLEKKTDDDPVFGSEMTILKAFICIISAQ